MSDSPQVPLEAVRGLPDNVVEHFKAKGFHTGNHLMEIASMPAGEGMLRGELASVGLHAGEADACIAAIRASLGPDARKAAAEPLDTSQFGLGALKPK